MNTELLAPPVQFFLQTHAKDDPAQIALQKSPFANVSSAELAVQIESRRKAKKKLPTWYATPGIYWPAPVSIEQSSSEQTAAHKAQLIPSDATLIDLTGGVGVDTFYFARRVKKVIHCEINTELSAIAAYNLQLLNEASIEFRVGDGIDILQQLPTDAIDIAYIDPSRRVQRQKVFLLSACEPNLVLHQETLRKHVQTCLIKASPLLDIRATLSELQCVKTIYIVSVQNEVKELLLIMERNWERAPLIVATNIHESDSYSEFAFQLEDEQKAVPVLGTVRMYLYEPDASLMKAGCFKLISEKWKVEKLHTNTHLYTADRLITDFPGRVFQVMDQWAYSDFKKQKARRRASVVCKNFPLKAEALRKKHHIGEDPQHFLFFYKDINNQLKTLWAERCVF